MWKSQNNGIVAERRRPGLQTLYVWLSWSFGLSVNIRLTLMFQETQKVFLDGLTFLPHSSPQTKKEKEKKSQCDVFTSVHLAKGAVKQLM